MNTLSIQIINFFFQESSSEVISQFYNSINLPDTENGHIKINDIIRDRITLELFWKEQKLIRGVYKGTSIQDLILPVARNAKISIMPLSQIMISTGLNRQYSKATDLLPSTTNLIKPSYSETHFDLRRMLEVPNLTNLVSQYVTDIELRDLPIENITAAALKLKSCNIKDLQSLMNGTKTAIKKITLHLKDDEVEHISISSRGMIKIFSSVDDWAFLHNFIYDFLFKLQLL